MHIICLTPLAEGIYNDHSAEHITMSPEGWAVILHEGDPVPLEWAGKDIDYSLPSTFPRLGSIEAEELTYTREVEVETEDGMVTETREYKMMTVTAMTEGTLPEPEPEPEPTAEERITALEEQLAETDEAAIQLYEASLAQEAVNAEQDEAIIEIYEKMEEMSNG